MHRKIVTTAKLILRLVFDFITIIAGTRCVGAECSGMCGRPSGRAHGTGRKASGRKGNRTTDRRGRRRLRVPRAAAEGHMSPAFRFLASGMGSASVEPALGSSGASPSRDGDVGIGDLRDLPGNRRIRRDDGRATGRRWGRRQSSERLAGQPAGRTERRAGSRSPRRPGVSLRHDRPGNRPDRTKRRAGNRATGRTEAPR